MPDSMPASYQSLLGAIPADYYHREDVLTAEIEHVFKPSWLCVGFSQDLKHDKDFITAQIGPHSIVVQNFKGELKAFRNVCSHRFARLQTGVCGNRKLVCPYHGWVYNSEGIPAGIPQNEQAFGLDEADRKHLALEPYDVAVVGQFVFVRMQRNGNDLRAFLGKVYDFLEHVSDVCPDRIDDVTFTVKANWKLGIENGVEAYHHAMVHSDTFATILTQDITMNTYGAHCTHEGRVTDKGRQDWDRLISKARLEPSAHYTDYISFLIFPNIVTTFTAGALFTLQILTPTAVQSVNIRSTAWLAKGSEAVRPYIVPSLNAFAAKVREEDRVICETAQAGVAERGLRRAPLLGDVDNRIRHFQDDYTRLMAGGGLNGV